MKVPSACLWGREPVVLSQDLDGFDGSDGAVLDEGRAFVTAHGQALVVDDDFAIISFVTEYTMQPAEIAGAVEERGFALGLPEHTHIPTSRKTPYLLGGDRPKE